ncbi:MAG: hypothetical protein ACE5HP_07255 [Gemmatimonadota bacterium]
MSVTSLEALPEDARVWIFGADRPVEEAAADRLRSLMIPFLSEWTAHDRELRAACELHEDRFLVVAVDERPARASGCSIDALVHHVRSIETELGIGLLDGTPVWYRSPEGRIETTSRDGFRKLAEQGAVDARTPVFDLAASRLGDLRAEGFERPARQSWHARLLERAGASARKTGEAGED